MATAGAKAVDCKLEKVKSLRLKKAKRKFSYRGIVVSGDMIMVADFYACNVRLHRLKDGGLLATHRLESQPRGICLTNDNEICVILYNGQIVILSVKCTGDTGTITPVRTLRVKGSLGYFEGVMKFKDNVVICGVNKDTIYWCIVSLNDGHVDDTIHRICTGYGGYLCYLTAKDNIIYISCRAHFSHNTGVYGYTIENPSKQTFIYKDKELNAPSGITVDAKGFIFVCNNTSIYHLSDKFELVSIYKQGISREVENIFWDQQHGYLYVSRSKKNIITKYKPVYDADRKASEVLLSYERKQPVIEESSTQIGQEIVDKGQSSVETEIPRSVQVPEDSDDDKQGDHKAPEVPVRDEGKQPVIAETSTQIRQEIVDKGQLSVETEMPPSVQVPNDSEDNKQDLLDGDEFLEAIINNNQKVEEMIRNQKIPNQSIIEVAMKRDRYSIGVQRVLMEMSKLLRMEISEAVGVWCGYRPEDPHTPVFVVTLKDQKCILKKEEIPEPFMGYKIITRYKYVPDDEERSIVEQYSSKSVRSEDVARVNNCIAKHTESLMREHSNLSIIRPCPIKTSGYMRKQMKVKTDTCIVFYVPVKGIIPVGENEFPKDIDGTVTDVREGEFVLFGDHNAMLYHQNIRIGCCISRCKIGSLGGFVDLPGGKVGCLTAAHVVLTDEELQKYILNGDEEKRKFNYSLAQGEKLIEMHQPQPLPDHKSFGTVHTIALEAGNIFRPSVDAAIIQITDDGRKPETGNFPDGNFENIGLIKENPLLYTSGELVDDTETCQKESQVIKFGCTTGLTNGCLTSSESSVRLVNVWGNYCFPVMFKQFEVLNLEHEFAAMGDSGSLVFLCVGNDIRNLRALGLVIGGNTAGGSCVVTPIKAVFKKLGLKNNRFKVFPASQPSQLSERINAQGQALSNQNEEVKEHSVKIDSIETRLAKVERKVNSLEGNINKLDQDMKEGFSKNANNMSESFKRMEYLISQMRGVTLPDEVGN